MKTQIKNYYNIGNSEVIYSAKTTQRLLARFIDFFIAIFPGWLINTIFLITANPTVSESSLSTAATLANGNLDIFLQDFFITQYSTVLILGWSFIILGIIVVFYLIPLLNKKHKGQSIGKKIMKITPIYLNDKGVYSFIGKEVLITGFFIITFSLKIAGGIDHSQWYYQYTTIKNFNTNINLITSLQNQMPDTNHFNFLLSIASNDLIIGSSALNSSIPFVILFSDILLITSLVLVFISFIFSLIKTNNETPLDLLFKLNIVDLKTIKKEDEAISQDQKDLRMG